MKSCDSVSLSETRSPIRRSEMISARFSGRLCALRGARARSASPHLSALIRLHCRIETLHYGDHCEAALQALIRLRNLDSLLQEGGFNERFALHWLFSKAHPFNTVLKSQSAVGSFRSFYPFLNFLLWYYLRFTLQAAELFLLHQPPMRIQFLKTSVSALTYVFGHFMQTFGWKFLILCTFLGKNELFVLLLQTSIIVDIIIAMLMYCWWQYLSIL